MNNPDLTDKRHLTRLFITLAGAALIAGLWVGYMASRDQSSPPPNNINATLLPQPKTLHPFQLIDHNQQPFGTEQLQGQWTFMFFGYTHCPDVCPNALFMFQGVHKQLQKYPEVLKNTRFTLVSVDPQRDTPKQLGEFVHYYHPDFIGVTGEEKEIRNLAQQVGSFYMRNDEDGTDNYQVDHSASILLVDPKGRLYSLFSPPHQTQPITSDYLVIRNYYEENPS